MMRTRVWVTGILLTALICLAALLLSGNRDGRIVNVYSNGECLYSAGLDSINDPYEYTVRSENGITSVLLFTQDGVSVISAGCPDGICVRTGVISDGTVPIICLPAKLSISVETESALNIDSISR